MSRAKISVQIDLGTRSNTHTLDSSPPDLKVLSTLVTLMQLGKICRLGLILFYFYNRNTRLLPLIKQWHVRDLQVHGKRRVVKRSRGWSQTESKSLHNKFKFNSFHLFQSFVGDPLNITYWGSFMCCFRVLYLLYMWVIIIIFFYKILFSGLEGCIKSCIIHCYFTYISELDPLVRHGNLWQWIVNYNRLRYKKYVYTIFYYIFKT